MSNDLNEVFSEAPNALNALVAAGERGVGREDLIGVFKNQDHVNDPLNTLKAAVEARLIQLVVSDGEPLKFRLTAS